MPILFPVDQAVELYRRGIGVGTIARRLNFNYQTVRKHLLRDGVFTRKTPNPSERRAVLEETAAAYEKHRTRGKTAEALGVSKLTVSRRLRALRELQAAETPDEPEPVVEDEDQYADEDGELYFLERANPEWGDPRQRAWHDVVNQVKSTVYNIRIDRMPGDFTLLFTTTGDAAMKTRFWLSQVRDDPTKTKLLRAFLIELESVRGTAHHLECCQEGGKRVTVRPAWSKARKDEED